jgi:hypothetical protein
MFHYSPLLVVLHSIYPNSREPRAGVGDSVFHFVREEEDNSNKATQSTNDVKE